MTHETCYLAKDAVRRCTPPGQAGCIKTKDITSLQHKHACLIPSCNGECARERSQPGVTHASQHPTVVAHDALTIAGRPASQLTDHTQASKLHQQLCRSPSCGAHVRCTSHSSWASQSPPWTNTKPFGEYAYGCPLANSPQPLKQPPLNHRQADIATHIPTSGTGWMLRG